MTGRGRLPRTLHPAAWWAWALGLAVASTATTNPLLLLLIIAVLCLAVAARGRPSDGLLGFRLYLGLALVVLLVRIVFRVVFGAGIGPTVVFTLPEIPLPAVAAGIRIGGPVTAEGLAAAFSDGLRLATMIVCVGAANALADPRRLLRATPAALHDVATAVVLALSIAPQLVTAFARVRRARRLRGSSATGLRGLRPLLVPVLEDGLDRSLALAAAMDSKGFGRTGPDAGRSSSALSLAGVATICVGTYGLLDGTAPWALGWPALLVGGTLALAGVRAAGVRATRSTYRPDSWRPAEVAVAVTGVTVGVAVLLSARLQPDLLHPSTTPLAWPELPVLAALAVLTAAAVVGLTPPLRHPRPSAREHGEGSHTSTEAPRAPSRLRPSGAGGATPPPQPADRRQPSTSRPGRTPATLPQPAAQP